jgi:hypothetical protein
MATEDSVSRTARAIIKTKENFMYESSNKPQTHAQKLAAEIKKAFPKLNDEEIGYQASNPTKFYDAVKTKQGINKDEAEKTVKKLDTECAAACTASGKSSDAASKPAAKAANA